MIEDLLYYSAWFIFGTLVARPVESAIDSLVLVLDDPLLLLVVTINSLIFLIFLLTAWVAFSLL